MMDNKIKQKIILDYFPDIKFCDFRNGMGYRANDYMISMDELVRVIRIRDLKDGTTN